jgi:hypothetical protein
VSSLVLDRSRSGQECVDHVIKFPSAERGKPLQYGPESGLKDGKARHSRHWCRESQWGAGNECNSCGANKSSQEVPSLAARREACGVGLGVLGVTLPVKIGMILLVVIRQLDFSKAVGKKRLWRQAGVGDLRVKKLYYNDCLNVPPAKYKGILRNCGGWSL